MEENKHKDVLRFYVEDDLTLVRESWEDIEDSIFSLQYERFLTVLDDSLPLITTSRKESDIDAFMRKSAERTSSNVFAFIGDRGAGKSSCMLSVAQMLYDVQSADRYSLSRKYGNVVNRRYYILDTIDPSFFNKRANVMELVLGKMFMNFRDAVSGRIEYLDGGHKGELKNTLFDDFQRVLRCIANIDGVGIEVDDDILKLEMLTDAVELQTTMQRLINHYLDFFGSDILVISIDDMDLHTDCGYTLLEQVRKYLVQKNTVVLMSLRLDQMKRVIELENVSKYRPLLDQKMISTGRINEKASRYLAKLIPQSHRVFLPSVDVLMDTKLQLHTRKNGKDVKVDESVFPSTFVKNAVTDAIYRKTRYIFYHNQGQANRVVPRNMRDLRHLIGMLYIMPDYQSGSVANNNREVFKNYFFNTWTAINLGQHGNEIVQTLLSVGEASVFNKTVVDLLRGKFSDSILNGFVDGTHSPDKNNEIYCILDEQNTSYNVSLGDVIVLIEYLKARVTSQYDMALLFAISTLYSIKLHEGNLMRMREKAESVTTDVQTEPRTLLWGWFDNVSSYDQIVGGCIVNTKNFRLMTPSTSNLKYDKDYGYRDIRSVRLSNIMRAIGTLKYDHDGTLDEEQRNSLLKAELFSMMIHRKKYNTKKKGRYDQDYRKRNEVVFLDPNYGQSGEDGASFDMNQTVYFDVASLLVNIANMRMAYSRFDRSLWNMANKYYGSLLNQLRKATVITEKMPGRITDPDGECIESIGDFFYTYRSSNSQHNMVVRNYVRFDIEGRGKVFFETDMIDRRISATMAVQNFEVIESLIWHLTTSLKERTKIVEYVRKLSEFKVNTYGDRTNMFSGLLKAYCKILEGVQDFDSMLESDGKEKRDDLASMSGAIVGAVTSGGWRARKNINRITDVIKTLDARNVDGFDDDLRQQIIDDLGADGRVAYTQDEFRQIVDKSLAVYFE